MVSSFLQSQPHRLSKWLGSHGVAYEKVCLLGTSTGFLLLLSVVLGSRRRRSKSSALKAVLWASYTMTPYLIGFTMGLMLTSGFWSEKKSDGADDIILWPMLLLIAFGSADSLCAYSWLDCEQSKRYNWQFVLKLGGLVIIILSYYVEIGKESVYFPVVPFLFVAILLKVSTKNGSLEAASTSALEKSCKLDAEYLSLEHEWADMPHIDHRDMEGRVFFFEGEEIKTSEMRVGRDDEIKPVIALQKVWSCKGKLLSSAQGSVRLKDCCMSFSFYKLLRLKYAGYKLPSKVHSKALHLIHNIWLEGDRSYERVFAVVEEELSFLFDLFYTKRPLIFRPYGFYTRFLEFILIGIGSFVLIVRLFTEHADRRRSFIAVALMIYFLAEAMQFFILLFTTWTKITCIRLYVKRESFQTSARVERWARLILRLPSPKPWERTLHQYSLLESCCYRPCKLFSNKLAYMFIDWTRDGQKESSPISLSKEVKAAVLNCLKLEDGSKLENGMAFLRRRHMDHLLWACRLETQTEVIMVWHIATTMCETRVGNDLHPPETATNFQVATSLSKYLAYLVAFVPRLLPDHPSVTESSFDDLIIEARGLLKGCRGVQKRANKLIASAQEEADTTLRRGAKLGKQLINRVDLWEILAGFWTETMLYVAPSKDIRAHAEQLANGGEFVTHLWALLYCIGIKKEKGLSTQRSPGHPCGS